MPVWRAFLSTAGGRECVVLPVDSFPWSGVCWHGNAGSTLRSSQAVPHPSTNRALCRLTSEVRRDPVHSTWYGRQRFPFKGVTAPNNSKQLLTRQHMGRYHTHADRRPHTHAHAHRHTHTHAHTRTHTHTHAQTHTRTQAAHTRTAPRAAADAACCVLGVWVQVNSWISKVGGTL